MKIKQIGTIGLALLLLAGCQSTNAETEIIENTVPVELSSVQMQDIKNEIIYVGQIQPESTIHVVGKMSGIVKDVFYDIGDHVNENDVLYRLDEEDIQNQIRQLQASLNSANASLSSAQTGYSHVTGGQWDSQVLALETNVETAKMQLDTAENSLAAADNQIESASIALQNARDTLQNVQDNYNRTKTLYEAGTATKANFDAIELQLKQAQAAVEQSEITLSQAQQQKEQAVIGKEQAELAYQQAQESYNITTDKIIDENIETARGSVNVAAASRQTIQVQLDIARSTLNDTAVRSPIAGYVSARTINSGEMAVANPSSPSFTIVNMDTVSVNVNVSENIINSIRLNQEVDVFIQTLSEAPYVGKITAISPAADNTSTYPVKIEIQNHDLAIKPGMYAEVHFIREQNQNTIVFPRNTVMNDDETDYVYVSNNGVAQKVAVVTGIDNGFEIEIISGLSANDLVITKGQSSVAEGDKLNAVSIDGISTIEENSNNDNETTEE